jgi:hypothetical protein
VLDGNTATSIDAGLMTSEQHLEAVLEKDITILGLGDCCAWAAR